MSEAEVKTLSMNLSADLEGYRQGLDVAETMLQGFHNSATLILESTKAEAEATQSQVSMGLKRTLALANIVVGTVEAVVNIIGMQLEPIHQLQLDLIATSVSVSLSLATMWSANPITNALGVALAAISMTTQTNANIAAYQGRLRQRQTFLATNMAFMRAGDHLKVYMNLFNGM